MVWREHGSRLRQHCWLRVTCALHHRCLHQTLWSIRKSGRQPMGLLLQLCYVLQEQKQAALDKSALQAEMHRSLQAKDSEILGLVADRMRLDAALASIKGQVTSAASPARSDSTTSKPSVSASVDSQTLRSEQ